MTVTAKAHAERLSYFKEHADTIWVAPSWTVVDYVASTRKNCSFKSNKLSDFSKI